MNINYPSKSFYFYTVDTNASIDFFENTLQTSDYMENDTHLFYT